MDILRCTLKQISKFVKLFFGLFCMSVIKYLSSGNLSPTSISVSQQKGEFCPQITASFFIENTTTPDVPEDISISIDGVAFSGIAHKTSFSLNADGKHIANVTYLHESVAGTLDGFGQDVLYISCPKAQYDALRFDETHIVVKWKKADVYGNGGWNSKSVIENIFSLVNKEITVDIEPIDIGSTTLRYSKGSSIIEFAKSALIGADVIGYVFHIDADGNLKILLPGKTASSHRSTSIPAVSLQGDIDHVTGEYNAFSFTGGQAKPILAEYKYIKTVAIAKKTEIEKTTTETSQTTQEITKPDGTSTNTTIITSTPLTSGTTKEITTKETTRLYDFKDDEFCIVSQSTEKESSIFNHNGEVPQNGVVFHEFTTYEYENADPLTYEKPRQTKCLKTTSQIATKYAIGLNALTFALNSKGKAFLLLADNTIKTYAEYMDLWPDVETVIAGSYVDWIDDIMTESETISYVQEKDSTRDRPEGTILLNETSSSEQCVLFTVSLGSKIVITKHIRVSESGETGLKEIGDAMTKASEGNDFSGEHVVSVSPASLITTQITRKDIDPLTTKGTYKWRVTTKTFNFDTGKFDTQTQEVTIPGGRIPSEPTQYRRQDILYESGLMGQPVPVKAFTMSIGTNNRSHLRSLADIVIGEKTEKVTTEYQISDVSNPYFQGDSFNGWIVTGWSIESTAEKDTINITVSA